MKKLGVELSDEDKFGIIFLMGLILSITMGQRIGLGGIVVSLFIAATFMFLWIKPKFE